MSVTACFEPDVILPRATGCQHRTQLQRDIYFCLEWRQLQEVFCGDFCMVSSLNAAETA